MLQLPYKKLLIWQKAMDLTERVYGITWHLPASERFGLVSQLQRAVVSVPSNIAEGSQKSTKKNFMEFIAIATGSLAEVETQLLLAERLKFIDKSRTQECMVLIQELQKMLWAFRAKLLPNTSSLATSF